MISVSVEADISKAVEFLRLLPREAERAAYRSMNKIADEVKKDSAKRISQITGLTRNDVLERMYVRRASAKRLLASVHALPSARNVGRYRGASPTPGKPGVTLTAWKRRTLYDKTFVMGAQKNVGVPRKVWKRTGPGPSQISDQVWGPSVRKTMERPAVYYAELELIQKRWPRWFQHYLRGELVKLRGAAALKGIRDVLPGLTGPTFSPGE